MPDDKRVKEILDKLNIARDMDFGTPYINGIPEATKELTKLMIGERIDETSKWLEIAELAQTEYAQRGLAPEIPIETQIEECKKRIEQLKSQL